MEANLAIHLDSKHRLKGYATLALKLALEFAFYSFAFSGDGVEYSVEWAAVRSRIDNEGMKKVMKKLKDELPFSEREEPDLDNDWFSEGIAGIEWRIDRTKYLNQYELLWGNPQHFKGRAEPTDENPNSLQLEPESRL